MDVALRSCRQVHRKFTEEEWEKVRKQVWIIDKQNRILDKIVGRRKKRRSYEYEVSGVACPWLKSPAQIPLSCACHGTG